MFPGAVFVSYENVLSTNGLMKLYKILLQRNGLPQTTQDASAIIVAAQEGTDRAAVDSLEYYACWLGRFAGDLALLYDARGGLYLGGGIPPKIIEFLNAGKFRTAFEAKGELAPYLGQIPVYVIRAADAGLRGAALALGALKN
jgi:glucokinase